jgi:hypothetical protein
MRWLLVLALLAAVAGLALLAWLPVDPFEEPAGPLDRLVPADVELALRFDASRVADSEAARALWEHPALAGLRERAGLDERVLAPLRQAEALPALDDPPSAARDLAGGEVVVAARGGELLVLSRLSRRARYLEVVRRLDAERLAALGLPEAAGLLVLRIGDGTAVHLARHRDVLVAATAPGLVQ